MLELATALLAGAVTVASPCILPMLPILLGASWGRRDPRRPLLIVLGFVASFATTALVFGVFTRVLGVSQGTVRGIAIGALLLFGVLSLLPRVFERLAGVLAPISDRAARLGQSGGDGPFGGLALGATLGALWAPCAGPVLASILVMIASAPDASRAAPLLLAYAVGTGLPMLAIAYGGQTVSSRIRRLARHGGVIRQAFGLLVIATALAMLWEVDVAAFDWALPEIEAPAPAEVLRPGEPAPELAGIEAWLNSPPLQLAGLRGKVVLIDFWTYACSNCVRTLPALKRWHERYASQGLVLIGIHTPEFPFEREMASVQAAIQRHRIPYPVALDNRYQTWTAWRNRYWPSVYLIDRDGRLLLSHAGEGDYEAIERAIERALASER